jgi:hypothetical protein
MRRNRRNAAAFRIEREQLPDLPHRRTTDFVKGEVYLRALGMRVPACREDTPTCTEHPGLHSPATEPPRWCAPPRTLHDRRYERRGWPRP